MSFSPASVPFRDINVHASPSRYTFHSPSTPNHSWLVIERPTGDVKVARDGKPDPGAKRVSSIAGIMGMIRLRLDKYIIVITKAVPVGKIKGHTVYQVKGTEFWPIRERALHDADEDTYLALLREHLRTGPMYFSYTFDLTNTFQRQSSANPALPLWQRADDRFFWNRHVVSDFVDFRASHDPNSAAVDPFILPIMFGMMRITTNIKVKSTPLTWILITRRSRFRAGTRYFSRGIDDQGHVSNFNETEMIVILNDLGGGMADSTSASGDGFVSAGSNRNSQQAARQILSYVQIRGSVPAYWAEINNLRFIPKLQVRGPEMALDAARKHFDEQIAIYGDIYLVNLVNQSGREQRVKNAYESVVRSVISGPVVESKESSARTSEQFREIEAKNGRGKDWYNKLHYIFFDFHHECRGLRWHRATLLLDQMHDALKAQGYFYATETGSPAVGNPGLSVRNTQASVVRSNCMDCLDRTNVVQSMLARWTLNRMLLEAGVLEMGETFEQSFQFEDIFRNVWADNADVVSKSYSGTGALKTDFTRTGRRTKHGNIQDGINSLTRYVRNNFLDGPRQDAFDLFLGAYLPSSSSSMRNLLFVDKRPLIIQGMPYVLLFSLFVFLCAMILPRPANEGLIPLRGLVIFLVFVMAYSANFIWRHGMLYVNWPKLRQLSWANEGYQDAMGHAMGDVIVGRFLTEQSGGTSIKGGRPRASTGMFAGVGGHGRGESVRLVNAEEGKKRMD